MNKRLRKSWQSQIMRSSCGQSWSCSFGSNISKLPWSPRVDQLAAWTRMQSPRLTLQRNASYIVSSGVVGRSADPWNDTGGGVASAFWQPSVLSTVLQPDLPQSLTLPLRLGMYFHSQSATVSTTTKYGIFFQWQHWLAITNLQRLQRLWSWPSVFLFQSQRNYPPPPPYERCVRKRWPPEIAHKIKGFCKLRVFFSKQHKDTGFFSTCHAMHVNKQWRKCPSNFLSATIFSSEIWNSQENSQNTRQRILKSVHDCNLRRRRTACLVVSCVWTHSSTHGLFCGKLCLNAFFYVCMFPCLHHGMMKKRGNFCENRIKNSKEKWVKCATEVTHLYRPLFMGKVLCCATEGFTPNKTVLRHAGLYMDIFYLRTGDEKDDNNSISKVLTYTPSSERRNSKRIRADLRERVTFWLSYVSEVWNFSGREECEWVR